MNFDNLLAVSKRRVLVECTWLEALCDAKEIKECKPLSAKERKALRAIASEFSVADAQRVKDIEKTTNHDVKAVEYFLKEKVKGTSLEKRGEFIHFACTSEDINNMSHALMLRDGKKVLRAAMDEMTAKIAAMAKEWAKVPMLAHTHGRGRQLQRAPLGVSEDRLGEAFQEGHRVAWPSPEPPHHADRVA